MNSEDNPNKRRERWLVRIFIGLTVISILGYWNRSAIKSKGPKLNLEVDKRPFREIMKEKIAKMPPDKSGAVATSTPTPTPEPISKKSAKPEKPDDKSDKVAKPEKSEAVVFFAEPPQNITPPVNQQTETRSTKNDRVPKTIYADVITTEGVITIRLLPNKAPRTVKNFIKHCEEITTEADYPVYNGLQIFRAIPDYFIQMGDPENTGRGSLGFLEANEFNTPGSAVDVGMVAMAKVSNATSNTQFYIALRNMEKLLDSSNTVFGVVVTGLQTAIKISKVKADFFDKPVIPVIIKEIRIRKIYDNTKGQKR